ncbi:PREDICTED: probable E3 ubiquitin-protein ligase RNF217 [Condylura cristata]|uniref:probable E3 ubiquitin-protein ligase RNF217 n=1 Tax=Condylura cristata TaxID=143302 RepID=UPI0003346E9E|nr:PREDICTED: probable E3 ubiquitin-protein ligase RNF217 [Condylura cristata]
MAVDFYQQRPTKYVLAMFTLLYLIQIENPIFAHYILWGYVDLHVQRGSAHSCLDINLSSFKLEATKTPEPLVIVLSFRMKSSKCPKGTRPAPGFRGGREGTGRESASRLADHTHSGVRPSRPRGDSAGAPGLSAASGEPSGGGHGSDSGCADTSSPESPKTSGSSGWRRSRTRGQPAGLALAGPLNPQTLQEQLEAEEEEAGDRSEGRDELPEAPARDEPEPRVGVGAPDALVLDVLGPRRLPPAQRQVLCSVYCVENDLPDGPPAEQISPTASPPRVPPVTNPPDTPTSFPSPRLPLPTDPLAPDGSSIELEFYLAPEPFSVPSLLGAPPYSGLGGVGDPYAPLMVLMCRVCLEDKPIKPLPCCKKAVCEECLKVYLSSQVQLGQVEIKCPITECFEFLEETTVIYNLTHEDSIKYKYFLELGRIDSSTKPCPQCKHFTTFKKKGHIPTPSRSESKYKIQCPTCQFVWCFKCHSPWHEGVNCKEYKKGDKLLRHWASEIEHGQRNAQKCPKCKIHIQRTEGCDHMTCSQCNTNFCYRCGERYRQLRFFGDHTSNLSIFGCKYRYLPERPHLRRLVRGSVCAGKLFVAPLILVLGLALGAIAVVIGLFVFPIYCLCKKQRKRSRTGMHW